ncbi:MAG TPA: sigma 54-interacting transcriptional regulator, partial [Desulfopila sp.]|nr:sigma 54-interacting transcriptional regulator [Desulfopila sp.]
FELADGGSIFLDEIGDLPLLTQTKILRVLETRTFERLGGTSSVSVDVRIIAATNKDLQKEVKKETFREDLYYRLNVIPVLLPPLCKRKEDIPLLVEAFIRRFNDQMGTKASFSRKSLELLMEYPFPGNVRELLNVVERCVALAADDLIRPKDLPAHISQSSRSKTSVVSLQEITAEAEKNHITAILRLTKGNRTQAAEILGISRKTLWEKINLHAIEP